MKRKNIKYSFFKKIIKMIFAKIKQLAKYILTTAKQTRLRTKIIYVLLALVAFGVFNYRKGEINLPVKVAIYNEQHKLYGNATDIYYMDDEELKELESNSILSVYRDGFKYYITGKGHKYRISRNEFLKCVYKREYSSNVKYEIGALSQGVVLTYKSINDEWEEEGQKAVYSEDITRLLNEKIKKYEGEEAINNNSNYQRNSGRIMSDEDEKKQKLNIKKKIKVERVTNAWSDLCYKYRVNASELMILYKYKYSELKQEDESKNMDRSYYQIIGLKTYFGKNYEKKDLTQNERPQSEHIRFDYRLLGIGNFVDMEDLIGYTTMISLDKQSKFRRKIKNRFVQKMEIANSVDIFKAAIYLNNDELPENLPYYTKTYTRGKDILQICIDNVNDVAFVAVFNTDDVITKKALSWEMNSFMLNPLKRNVWVNWYIVVRMVLFMIVEWLVFVYIGKRRKVKFNKSLNCLQ